MRAKEHFAVIKMRFRLIFVTFVVEYKFMFSFFSNKFPTSIILVLLLGNLACFSGRQGRGDTVKIQGAGSSFVNPLMQKWVSEYGNINPNIRIDYQSIGSGGGVKQTKERTIQFGATDVAIGDAANRESRTA